MCVEGASVELKHKRVFIELVSLVRMNIQYVMISDFLQFYNCEKYNPTYV